MNETLEQIMIKKAYQSRVPLTAVFELLPLCNMRCDMCYVRVSEQEVRKHGGLLPVERWIRMAGELADAGALFILLTGGEPLLFPDFRQLYLELRKRGLIINLNTNATLLDEDWADFFGKYKPRRVNITLYGSNEETYRRLCHFPEGFQKTLHGIQLLKERGVSVKLNASMTRMNAADFEEIYRIGEKLEVPVSTDTYMLPGRAEASLSMPEQSRLDPEEAARMQWRVLQKDMPAEVLSQYVKQVFLQLNAENPVYSQKINCQASVSSCAVDWQGMLRPCITLREPAIPWNNQKFGDIWEELFRNMQNLQLPSLCKSCSLRPLCPTCVGSVQIETGGNFDVPNYLCRYTSELFRLLQAEKIRLEHGEKPGKGQTT